MARGVSCPPAELVGSTLSQWRALIGYGHVAAASPPAPAITSAPESTQRQAPAFTVPTGHVHVPPLQLAFTQSAVHAPPAFPG